MTETETETQTRGRRIQVANARPEDSGSGLARLPQGVMAELDLMEGDTIEIIGKPACSPPFAADPSGVEKLEAPGRLIAGA